MKTYLNPTRLIGIARDEIVNTMGANAVTDGSNYRARTFLKNYFINTN